MQAINVCLTQPCPEKDGPVPWIPEEIPIYLLSHELSYTQQRWSVIEKEEYAIVYALQKLDYYLNSALFTIKTDHKPLKYLLKADWTNKKIQQGTLKITRYNCTIKYSSSKFIVSYILFLFACYLLHETMKMKNEYICRLLATQIILITKLRCEYSVTDGANNIAGQFGWVKFYDTLTFVGNLMPNPFYTYKQFYFKQFSLV